MLFGHFIEVKILTLVGRFQALIETISVVAQQLKQGRP
jgi:hypothetical protein